MSTKGGKQVGEEYRRRFAEWLETAESIPENAATGGADVTSLSRLLGIPRSSFYKNPGMKELLDQAIAKKGLRPVSARTGAEGDDGYARSLEQKIKRLEETVDAQRAEIQGLREELKILRACDDHLIQTGRLPR